jgi:hypothetical protein
MMMQGVSQLFHAPGNMKQSQSTISVSCIMYANQRCQNQLAVVRGSHTVWISKAEERIDYMII